MPIYEYRCPKGHQYERWESFDAPSEHACPHCGGTAQRLLSIPAVIFKGPGFYSTENRKDGHRQEEGDPAKASETSSASSSDSQPKSEASA